VSEPEGPGPGLPEPWLAGLEALGLGLPEPWVSGPELSGPPAPLAAPVPADPADPADPPEQAVRALRAAGPLADAAALVDQLGPYGVADGPDATTSLGAAVLEAYGDQLAATDRGAADAAYQQAAQSQRSFAAAATAGAEGLARMAEADRIDAKRRP
jgi:hypothetical protein